MSAFTERDIFIRKLHEVTMQWRKNGIPPRRTLLEELDALTSLRLSFRLETPLSRPLSMLTATLDDGWGLGLEVIHRGCDVLGVKYNGIGLIQSPEIIIKRCREEEPDFLGLTILQEDSLKDLERIHNETADYLKILVGGPSVKAAQDDLKQLYKLRFVANIREFMEFMLAFSMERSHEEVCEGILYSDREE